MVGKCKTNRQRQATTDDGIPTMEIGGAVEQMHGATAPAAASFLLAVHLGHDCSHRYAAYQRMPMLAIGRDYSVALFQHGDDAHRDCLFTIIEVKEAADLLLR